MGTNGIEATVRIMTMFVSVSCRHLVARRWYRSSTIARATAIFAPNFCACLEVITSLGSRRDNEVPEKRGFEQLQLSGHGGTGKLPESGLERSRCGGGRIRVHLTNICG
jgi:hypothetical protein